MNPKQLLKVRILSPRRLIFEGEAMAVSSSNVLGPFDILPFHANFITLIEKSPIRILKADNQVVTFALPLAILYQTNNVVSIYTDVNSR